MLVEGDDLNEPVADALRATLDGHIVLSRDLAHRGIYPAIDVLRSASRLLHDLVQPDQRDLAVRTVKILSTLERSRQLVELGAYVAGSNPELDRALKVEPVLFEHLRQSAGGASRAAALQSLAAILEGAA